MDNNSYNKNYSTPKNKFVNKKEDYNLEDNVKSIIKLKTSKIEFDYFRSIVDYCIVIKKNKNINLEKFYKKENYFSKENILKSYFISECLFNDIIKLPKLENPKLSNKKKQLLDLYFRVSNNEYLLLNYALSNFNKIKEIYESELLDDDDIIVEESIQNKEEYNNTLSYETGKEEDEFIDIFKNNIIEFPKEEVKLNLNKGYTSSIKIFKISDDEKNIINNKLGTNIDNLIFEKKYTDANQIMCFFGGNINKLESGIKWNINNEVKCLKKLYKKKHFPILLSVDFDKNIIYLNNCGETVDNENIPKNWKEQIKEIIKTLKNSNVKNNDMWINNFLIKNDIINLIDFGWGGTKNQYPFMNIEESEIDLNYNFIELLDALYLHATELRIEFENKF